MNQITQIFLEDESPTLSLCTIGSFGRSLASNSKRTYKMCISKNRLCQGTRTLTKINSNQPLYYPFNVGVNICGGSCNVIDDPYS